MIYLLWCHDEYGPDGLVATTNRNDVVPMAISEKVPEDAIGVIVEEMALGDEEFLKVRDEGKVKLQRGWGGWHLQIVREFLPPPIG